jgi:hypothetical protein
MSDANIKYLKAATEALEEIYDDAVDAVVDALCALPEDVRREAIFAACDDADWTDFSEYVVWSMTQGATKQTETSIRTEDGVVVVSLIPERVGRRT